MTRNANTADRGPRRRFKSRPRTTDHTSPRVTTSPPRRNSPSAGLELCTLQLLIATPAEPGPSYPFSPLSLSIPLASPPPLSLRKACGPCWMKMRSTPYSSASRSHRPDDLGLPARWKMSVSPSSSLAFPRNSRVSSEFGETSGHEVRCE